MSYPQRLASTLLAVLLTLPVAEQAVAGPWRDRLRERRTEQGGNELADLGAGSAQSCAEWSRKVDRLQARAQGRNPGPRPDLRDLAYGAQTRQTLDVFLPKAANDKGDAPIILMVHGGGWCVGDNAARSITENKVARWVP